MTKCEWFLRCDHEAEGVLTHPVLGYVPTCGRCAERAEQKLQFRVLAAETDAGAPACPECGSTESREYIADTNIECSRCGRDLRVEQTAERRI